MDTRKRRVLGVVFVVLLVFAAGTVHGFGGGDEYPSWTYDVGAGSGYSSDGGFAELNVGLNTHFTAWLTWRNAGFYRSMFDDDDYFGGDTSVLAGWQERVNGGSVYYQGGGGYRFTSIRRHAPFAEAAAGFRSSAFRLGANVKYILYELITDDVDNEIVFSVSVSGRLQGSF
ncbi:MAG: hypothetical protein ACLFRR_06080 [Spirochaetaceae bacterium]